MYDHWYAFSVGLLVAGLLLHKPPRFLMDTPERKAANSPNVTKIAVVAALAGAGSYYGLVYYRAWYGATYGQGHADGFNERLFDASDILSSGKFAADD